MGYKEECSLSLLCAVVGEDCKSDVDTYGGVVLWALFVLYTFKILAEVCDGHLTSVLERIVEHFNVSEDVAGATFLAMSSSAPEVFSSLVATFVIVSPTGVGNVVGSALFNLLCIIGVLPLVSKTGPLHIWWYPTMRDSFYYALAVVELYAFIQDGEVVFWEATVMVVTYTSYVLYFAMNATIMERFNLKPPVKKEKDQLGASPEPAKLEDGQAQQDEKEAVKQVQLTDSAPQKELQYTPLNKKKVLVRANSGVSLASTAPSIPDEQWATKNFPREAEASMIQSIRCMGDVQTTVPNSRAPLEITNVDVAGSKREINKDTGISLQQVEVKDPEAQPGATPQDLEAQPEATSEDTSEEDEEEPGVCTRYDPSLILIDKTMPNYDWMLFAFAIVVFWVALYTYFMVDAANRFGCFIDFPHVPMGLIVLAAGTSIPDMIASMSVAAAGCADMAAANAVGSNTFDILVGLGLPWMIRTMTGNKVEVPVAELNESITILGGALVSYVSILAMNGWILDRKIGVFLLSVYSGAIFVILYRHYTHFEDLQH